MQLKVSENYIGCVNFEFRFRVGCGVRVQDYGLEFRVRFNVYGLEFRVRVQTLGLGFRVRVQSQGQGLGYDLVLSSRLGVMVYGWGLGLGQGKYCSVHECIRREPHPIFASPGKPVLNFLVFPAFGGVFFRTPLFSSHSSSVRQFVR